MTVNREFAATSPVGSRVEPRRQVEQATHKFRIGEKLSWQAQAIQQGRSRGIVTVVMQMPPLGSELQYRVTSVKDQHDHVVLEHELSRDAGASDVFTTRS